MDDLSTDLCDGVKLIVLLELLSQKRLGKFTKKPRIHAQRMENVEIALQFITLKENIRLVNIGRSAIIIIIIITQLDTVYMFGIVLYCIVL